MTEFTCKRIGKKNLDLEQKIIKLYFDLCNQANELLWTLDSYLGYPDKENLEPSIFFEFMKCKDPRAFLYSKFIEKRDITFPGISISKVIELGLVDVPLEVFENLLDNRIKILQSVQPANELKFHFPLIKLWDPKIEMFPVIDTEDNLKYTITSTDFESKLNQHTGRFTASESDNVMLEAIEEAVNCFNKLIRLGVIKNNKGSWVQGISQLADAIVFSSNEENPLSVNPTLTRLRGFRRFFTETTFNPVMGRPEDILQFKEPAPKQFVETPEDLFQAEDQENIQSEENPVNLNQSEKPVTDKIEENSKEIVQTE